MLARWSVSSMSFLRQGFTSDLVGVGRSRRALHSSGIKPTESEADSVNDSVTYGSLLSSENYIVGVVGIFLLLGCNRRA